MVGALLTLMIATGALAAESEPVPDVVACDVRLSRMNSENIWQPQKLRTGELVTRMSVNLFENRLLHLLEHAPRLLDVFLEHLENPDHKFTDAERAEMMDHKLLQPDGSLFAEAGHVLRASVKHDGPRRTFVAAAPLESRTEDELRCYLERIDAAIVPEIVRLAALENLRVTPATRPPDETTIRTPADGTVLIDLGDDHGTIELITPFGRLSVIDGSGLGDVDAWRATKERIKKRFFLQPVNLNGEVDDARIFALTRDGNDYPLPLPDAGILPPKPEPGELRVQWNNLRPSGRAAFGNELKM